MGINVESAYLRFGPMVYRRCLHLLRHEGLAEDAMQDVFVHLVSHRDRLDDRGMSSFLFQIATHVSLNRLRTQRRRPETRDDVLLQQIADDTQSDDRGLAQVLLDRMFGREPASTRVIATLHYVDGASLEEVAEAVGMSVSGVRKRLRTLRAKGEQPREHGHD